MANPKTGESRLVPDLRPENIEEITETYTPEGGEQQTATYKIFNVPAIISGVLDKLAFLRTHASAVWSNKLAGRTVADEIEELNAKIIYADYQVTTASTTGEFVRSYGNRSIFLAGYAPISATVIGNPSYCGFATFEPERKTLYVWANTIGVYSVRVVYHKI